MCMSTLFQGLVSYMHLRTKGVDGCMCEQPRSLVRALEISPRPLVQRVNISINEWCDMPHSKAEHSSTESLKLEVTI